MWPRGLVVAAFSALALTGSHAFNLRRCDTPSSSAVEDPVTTTSAEPTTTAPVCSNLVGNPSFEDGNNDWEFYTATVTANDPSVAVTAQDGDNYVSVDRPLPSFPLIHRSLIRMVSLLG
jgi:hypothetical protein